MPTSLPTLHPQFVTDEEGQATAALLPIGEYRRIVELMEDIQDSMTLEEAHDHPEEAIPFAQIVQRLKVDGTTG